MIYDSNYTIIMKQNSYLHVLKFDLVINIRYPDNVLLLLIINTEVAKINTCCLEIFNKISNNNLFYYSYDI